MRLKKKIITDKIEFEYFVNVTTEGIFTTYLPPEIMEKLEKYGIHAGYGRGHKKGYFSTTSLQEIEERVEQIVEKFNQKKLKSSMIVLRYEITTKCSYCKTKTGEIVPNGSWQQKIDKNREYNWQNGTKEQNSTHASPFGFSIYVEPQKLNIYTFPDKSGYRKYANQRP